MIHPDIERGINQQINAEIYSALLYLQMASWFEQRDLGGCAHWMRMQYQEELNHVHKFFTYVHDRGGKVTMEAVQAPPSTWDHALAVFDAAYHHEVSVTGLINNLVSLALDHKDHATYSFLQWFVDEQVEEEATASKITGQLRLIDGNGPALLQLDKELASRVSPLLQQKGA